MPPDESADRPLHHLRCLGDEVMFCDTLNARQVAFEPAVGSAASSAVADSIHIDAKSTRERQARRD